MYKEIIENSLNNQEKVKIKFTGKDHDVTIVKFISENERLLHIQDSHGELYIPLNNIQYVRIADKSGGMQVMM